MKYILLIHGDETALGNLSEAERQPQRGEAHPGIGGSLGVERQLGIEKGLAEDPAFPASGHERVTEVARKLAVGYPFGEFRGNGRTGLRRALEPGGIARREDEAWCKQHRQAPEGKESHLTLPAGRHYIRFPSTPQDRPAARRGMSQPPPFGAWL